VRGRQHVVEGRGEEGLADEVAQTLTLEDPPDGAAAALVVVLDGAQRLPVEVALDVEGAGAGRARQGRVAVLET